MFDLAAIEAALLAPSLPASCISRRSPDRQTPMRLGRARGRSARLGLLCRRAATPAGGAAITHGIRPPGRDSMSVSCCARQSPRRALPLLPLAAGLAAAEAIARKRPQGGSALAQRSAYRRTQSRRHSRGVEDGRRRCSLSLSSASASTCTSAISPPTSRRPQPRSTLKRAAHQPPGVAVALLKSLERETLHACTIRHAASDSCSAWSRLQHGFVAGKLKCMARRLAQA